MSTTAWLAHNWGWVIFWVWILGGFSAASEWCRRALHTHHKRKIALAKAKAKAVPQPALAATGEKQPGPCVHRQVRPVVAADEVVAWLCKSCDAQLPADWAVRAEDL